MKVVVAYFAGVVTGWAARSAFGSLRGLAVRTVALGVTASEEARRILATEREFIEDIVAEGRAMAAAARASARPAAPSRAVA